MKLLILDLDETLIHAKEKPLERKADFKTDFYFVYKRPFIDEFLEFCRQNFKVGVWTTAGEYFAHDVVCHLFPADYSLEFVWSHQRCTRVFDSEFLDHYCVKDFKKLKRRGYCLEEIIMLDDTPRKLERNYGNLVRVTEWLGDLKDRELLLLIEYLTELKYIKNIRKIEKRGWQYRYKQFDVYAGDLIIKNIIMSSLHKPQT